MSVEFLSSFLKRHFVQGYDFNAGVDYHALLQSYKYSGFQATNFGLAVEEINRLNQVYCILFQDKSQFSLSIEFEEMVLFCKGGGEDWSLFST